MTRHLGIEQPSLFEAIKYLAATDRVAHIFVVDVVLSENSERAVSRCSPKILRQRNQRRHVPSQSLTCCQSSLLERIRGTPIEPDEVDVMHPHQIVEQRLFALKQI